MADEVPWHPTAERIERTALCAYLDWLEPRPGRGFPDRDALPGWAVKEPGLRLPLDARPHRRGCR